MCIRDRNIREGLSIEEVLPFFQKYKLKLRVFDIFYNLIYKYDPEVPNLAKTTGGPSESSRGGP